MDRWAELLLTVGGQGLSRAAGDGPAAPVESDTCLGRGKEGRDRSLPEWGESGTWEGGDRSGNRGGEKKSRERQRPQKVGEEMNGFWELGAKVAVEEGERWGSDCEDGIGTRLFSSFA